MGLSGSDISAVTKGGPPMPAEPWIRPPTVPDNVINPFPTSPLKRQPDASNPTVNNRTTEMINFMIVGSVSTKINVPIGTAITRPHSIGISVFKLESRMLAGTRYIIVGISIITKIPIANTGGKTMLNDGTITKAAPKPRNPRRKPPTAITKMQKIISKISKPKSISRLTCYV